MAAVSKAELIGMIFSAGALVVLVPLFGIVGAATAGVIAATVPALYFLARARLDMRTPLRFGADDMDLLRELAQRLTRRRAG